MRIGQMAWRNLGRNRRRTAVTVAAMAFALWVMVLYAGLVDGMIAGMERDAVDLEVGELVIVAPGYRDDPALHVVLPHPGPLVGALEARGYRAAPRLFGGGLAALGDESAGVRLVGIDVARDATVTSLGERVAEGAWLDDADPRGVVLGKRLARTLHARVGDELLVLSQAADGSIANDLFEVRGVLVGVGEGVDRGSIFLTAPTFRELMVLPEGAHQITVRTPPGADLARAADEVAALAPGAETRTWKQLLPTLASMIDSTEGLVRIIAFIVYVAVAILVLNAMLMAVFERIREFGVMKAIGYGPGVVFGLIVAESLLQAALATGIGLVAALPMMAYLSQVGIDTGALGGASLVGMSLRQRWTGIYGLHTARDPVIALWLMVALAVVWPALKAARIRPVDAMRYR